MSWLKEIWERLFHWSNIAHIANANEHDIWVSFYSNDFTLEQAEIEVAFREGQPNGQIGLRLTRIPEISWFRVESRRFHRYNKRARYTIESRWV